MARQAKDLCALGATDQEVADFLQISTPTLYRWRARYPEFCSALKAGKEAADDRVEKSLFHRAVGYSFDTVKVFNASGKPLIVPVREHVPPDVGAATLWLKNRRKDEWRDKQEVEHSGAVDLGSRILEARSRARSRRED